MVWSQGNRREKWPGVLGQALSLADSLRKKPFLKNVLVVMTGSAIGQAVGFAMSPVISRLFTPADFGVLGSFGAVTGVIATVATLDYSLAIMLPKRQEDAGQLLLLSCLAACVVTAFCVAACLLFPGWLDGLLGTRGRWLLVLFVLAVLGGGTNAALQGWCVRVGAFRDTSASQVVRGLSSNALQVGAGVLQLGAPGLVGSGVLAEFLASLNLLRVTRSGLPSFTTAATWRRLKTLANEYRDFPLYSATQNLMNALSNGLPVLLLGHFFGIAVAGSYAFCLRLLNAPTSLVIGALRQVLFQRAGEMQHQSRRLSPLFVKCTLGLFALGVVPAAVLMICSPQLFAWLFGAQWRSAGEYARYLVLWTLLGFCNLPAVLFGRVIRIQRALFVYNAFLLAIRVLALIVGGLYLTALQSVALFSLVGGTMNLALILLVGRALFRREGQLGLQLFRDALASLEPE